MKFLAVSLLLLGVYTSEHSPIANVQGVHIETTLPNVNIDKVSTLENIPLNIHPNQDVITPIIPVLHQTQNVQEVLPNIAVPSVADVSFVPPVPDAPNFISTSQPVLNLGPIPTAVTHQAAAIQTPHSINSNIFTPFIQQTAQKAANAVNQVVHTSKTSVQNAFASVVNFVKPSSQKTSSSQDSEFKVDTSKQIPTSSSESVSQKVSVSLTKSQYILSLSTLLIVALSTLFLQ